MNKVKNKQKYKNIKKTIFKKNPKKRKDLDFISQIFRLPLYSTPFPILPLL